MWSLVGSKILLGGSKCTISIVSCNGGKLLRGQSGS